MRRLLLPAAVVALLHCGNSSPTEPSTATTGRLEIADSGCACVAKPYPDIAIYIDGQRAAALPVFGKVALSLPPGVHQWSADSPTGGSHVTIQAGVTTSAHVFTNLGCPDPCTD